MIVKGAKRYPIRGFFGGLLGGIAITLFLLMAGVLKLGSSGPLLCIVVFTILGVVWALAGPTRSRNGRAAPATVGSAPASGAGPMPD